MYYSRVDLGVMHTLYSSCRGSSASIGCCKYAAPLGITWSSCRHYRAYARAHLVVSKGCRVGDVVLILECSTQDHSKQPSHEGHGGHRQVVPAVQNLGLDRSACTHTTNQHRGGSRGADRGVGGRGAGQCRGNEHCSNPVNLKQGGGGVWGLGP